MSHTWYDPEPETTATSRNQATVEQIVEDTFNVEGKSAPTGPLAAGPTGDIYVDHGSPCEHSGTVATCFLSPPQRERLIAKFQNRVDDAAQHCQDAITDLRMEKLVEKDEDLSWILELVLDVASMYVGGSLGSALKGFRGLGLKQLERIALEAEIGTVSEGWSSRALAQVVRVSDKRLESGTKFVLDRAKKAATKAAKPSLLEKRSEAIGYIDILRDQAAIGYASLREEMPGRADDAELMTLVEAFHVTRHLTTQYKAAIEAKMQRYEQSGVGKIGRTFHVVPRGDEWPGREGTTVPQDTRLVWRSFTSGRPKELAYEWQDLNLYQQSDKDLRFGEGSPFDGPTHGNRVPAEFIEIALQRHEQAWGGPPGTIVIDDWWFARGTTRPNGPAPSVVASPSSPEPAPDSPQSNASTRSGSSHAPAMSLLLGNE